MIEYEKGMYSRGDGATLKPGDAFWGPGLEEEDDPKWTRSVHFVCRHLSEFYLTTNIHRKPLVVVLPNKDLFCVDGMCWSSGNYYGGWMVTGDAPNITVHPSINLHGGYHGFIQDGVISDDVEGRQF